MENNHKKVLFLGIAVIVVFGFILVLSALFLQEPQAILNSNSVTSTQQPSGNVGNNLPEGSDEKVVPIVITDPIKDWRVFSDKQFSFEFKYPKNYSIEAFDGITKRYVVKNASQEVASFTVRKWKDTVIEEGTPGTFWTRIAYNNWRYFTENSSSIKTGTCTDKDRINVPGPTTADSPKICDLEKRPGYVKIETENYIIFHTSEIEVRWEFSAENKDIVDSMTSTFVLK